MSCKLESTRNSYLGQWGPRRTCFILRVVSLLYERSVRSRYPFSGVQMFGRSRYSVPHVRKPRPTDCIQGTSRSDGVVFRVLEGIGCQAVGRHHHRPFEKGLQRTGGPPQNKEGKEEVFKAHVVFCGFPGNRLGSQRVHTWTGFQRRDGWFRGETSSYHVSLDRLRETFQALQVFPQVQMHLEEHSWQKHIW